MSREDYRAQRDAAERDLAHLQPVEQPDDRLDALAAYVESLPTAWADATPEQRNQLANIIYEEVWVDGPAVEYVKPRPELEALFQVRTGASQPLDCLSHSNVASGDPDGGRDAFCHGLHRLVASRPHLTSLPGRLTARTRVAVAPERWMDIADRVAAGASLRAVAREYGVSHECIRGIAAAVSVHDGVVHPGGDR